MIDKITINDFSPYLNSAFEVDLETERLALKLVAVEELSTRSMVSEERRKPFSLLFHGPSDRVLPQHIYPLEQQNLGTLEIFLVPVGPDQATGNMRYEAIFN